MTIGIEILLKQITVIKMPIILKVHHCLILFIPFHKLRIVVDRLRIHDFPLYLLKVRTQCRGLFPFGRTCD